MKARLAAMLADAGITIDGDQPHDIQVHDERLFARLARKRTIAAGESYVDGWWDCEQLDEMFHRALANAMYKTLQPMVRVADSDQYAVQSTNPR